MGRRRQARERVILYSRVSTEEQAASGLGLASQRAILDTEAARRGWDDVDHVVDDGYSAKTLARPGIAAALDDLAGGRASVLVVAKVDRLSRSLLDFVGLVELARHQRWQLVALDSPLDMTSPQGRLMANVMASFAEFERELISQRTAAAMAALKAQGARLGRPRLLSAATAARIAAARAGGRSLRQIVDDLNAEEVPSATGGRWHLSTVVGTLRSLALDAEAEAARL